MITCSAPPDSHQRLLPQWLPRSPRLLALCFSVLTGGCALQPAFQTPQLTAAPSWSEPSDHTGVRDQHTRDTPWWTELKDPALEQIISRAQDNNPTLAEALEQMAEAATSVQTSQADRLPSLTAQASVVRGREANSGYATADLTLPYKSTTFSPSLSWELDLFGRIRQSTAAASSRLAAKSADAEQARLKLDTDIALKLLSLRACNAELGLLQEQLLSRRETRTLTARRVQAGFNPPSELDRLDSSLAAAQTDSAAKQQECRQFSNALVSLTGISRESLSHLLSTAPPQNNDGTGLPLPPRARLKLPASVLASHPQVHARLNLLEAAWADIGIARAERWPKLDLSAALSNQWIGIMGTSLQYTTWSLGPTLAMTIFDGGKGAASVAAAEARYRQASARLEASVRTTVEEVENALASRVKADADDQAARITLASATRLYHAAEQQEHSGAINRIELEDTRRQLLSARQKMVIAHRDQSLAWVQLIKASGSATTPTGLE